LSAAFCSVNAVYYMKCSS